MKFDKRYKPELCASDDLTRISINHVHLDVERKKMVATDGHMMVIVPVEPEEGDTSGPITEDALASARKIVKGMNPNIKAEIKANGSLQVGGDSFKRDHNCNFPPWTMCVPKKRAVTIGINAKYLLDLAKAINASEGVVYLDIPQDEHDAIIVYRSDNGTKDTWRVDDGEHAPFGVLMPCRKERG